MLRRIAKIVSPILVILLGVAGYSYLKATKPVKQKRPIQEIEYAVKTAQAKIESITPTIKLYGTTVSGRQVDIRALVSGRVVEASPSLKNGGTFGDGDVMLRIDPFGYQSAVQESEAALAEAQARLEELQASLAQDRTTLDIANRQLEIADKDFKRAQPLEKRGTISTRSMEERQQAFLQRRQDVDRLINAIKVWDAKIAQQRALINRQNAALALSQRRLEETELRAPFAAYAIDVTSHVGRMVSANDKIATLIDRDWIEVRFTLSDEQFGRLIDDSKPVEGRDVTVNWTLGTKTVSYPAKIERVAGQVTAATGGVEVIARITDPHREVPLRAGAFVEVLIPDRTFEGVIRLPSTALYDNDTVYVIKDNRLAATKIDVVGSDGKAILVKGPVESGVDILITRISTPGDGVRVKSVE